MGIVVGLSEAFLAIVFFGVAIASMGDFGGEFLIIHERSWVLWAFAALLFAASMHAAISALRQRLGSRRKRSTQPSRCLPWPRPWRSSSSSGSSSCGWSTVSSSPSLYFSQCHSWMGRIARRRGLSGLDASTAAAGASILGWPTNLAFLLLALGIVGSLLTWNPRWAPSLERVVLFPAGLQPGRG